MPTQENLDSSEKDTEETPEQKQMSEDLKKISGDNSLADKFKKFEQMRKENEERIAGNASELEETKKATKLQK